MFLNIAKFKKLLKEAYEGKGLRVGRPGASWYCIQGAYWSMEVPVDYMKKEAKAALVELIGDLPAAGQGFTYMKKMETQSTMADTLWTDLWREAETGRPAEITRITVTTDGGPKTLIQDDNLEHIAMIRDTFLDCMDPEKKDKEESYMKIVMAGDNVIFTSDQMAVKYFVPTLRYTGELELLKALRGLELNWKQIEEEIAE